MPICVYCGIDKPTIEQSDEHIVPRAIGGNLLHNTLKIRVCVRCNNILGMFVDAPFTQGWLISSARATNAQKYIDFSVDSIVPLAFMGTFNEFPCQSKQCDLWLGPAGDTILHYHDPYPTRENVPPMVGVPSYCRGGHPPVDPGFVFAYIRATNPDWVRVILRSVQAQFSESTLYAPNVIPTPQGGRFEDIPGELQNIAEAIFERLRSNQEIGANFVIGTNSADRFLAKIALGLGAHLLDETFIVSEAANRLRRFMWERDPVRRGELAIHGTALMPTQGRDALNILNWPGGHTICLLPSRNSLDLYISFYEIQSSVIRVTDERQHWAGRMDPDGTVYVISPGLQRFVGPKAMPTLVAHRIDEEYHDADFAALLCAMRANANTPPFRI